VPTSPVGRSRQADGAGTVEPLLGGDHRAPALGRGVVLVDDRPPPVEHALLDLDRARGGGVHHRAQRRHVETCPRFLGQGQEAVELRRHHVAVRDATALDELEHQLRCPAIHDDDGVPEMQGGRGEGEHCGVVHRRSAEMDVAVVRLGAEEPEQEACCAGRGVGVGSRQPPADALGPAGRAGGVVHRRPAGAVVGPGVGLPGRQFREGTEAGHIAHDEAPVGGQRERIRRRPAGVAELLVTDEGAGLTVVDDVGDLGPHEVVVDRGQVPARLHGGEVQRHHLDPVREHGGHPVARGQAESSQPVDEAVRGGQQLAVGHLRPGRVDQGRPPRVLFGQLPEPHGLGHGRRVERVSARVHDDGRRVRRRGPRPRPRASPPAPGPRPPAS
jgi:hypothetical protein